MSRVRDTRGGTRPGPHPRPARRSRGCGTHVCRAHADRARRAHRTRARRRARAVRSRALRRSSRAAHLRWPRMAGLKRYAELAQLAARVAKQVGDAIAIEDIAIVTKKKGRANFATRADHSAEQAILRRLTQATPGVPVLAEASAKRDPQSGPLWDVDPI